MSKVVDRQGISVLDDLSLSSEVDVMMYELDGRREPGITMSFS